MICGFVDAMRAGGHGVESICRALDAQGLPVAPRSYRAWKRRVPADRTLADALVVDKLRGLRTGGQDGRPAPEILYGRRKMTAWLARNGFPGISKHTVDRLMCAEGMAGCVRGRGTRTTIPAKKGAVRAPDLLRRCFRSPRPNHAWVTDFTYVATWSGFVYVAFAIDLFSRAIVGWSASNGKDVAFVEECLKMALWRRTQTARPVPAGMIHHSDAGSQYTSVRFTDTLVLAGLAASIGTVGDALDNAAAETTIGLYKHEAVAAGSPFRTGPLRHLADVEALTMAYVHWYTHERLHGELGHRTPEEYEQAYYTGLTSPPPAGATESWPA